jgi:hypothetical protein
VYLRKDFYHDSSPPRPSVPRFVAQSSSTVPRRRGPACLANAHTSTNFGQEKFGAVSLATVVYVHKLADSCYAPIDSSHSDPIAAGLDVGGSQERLRHNVSTSALFPHPSMPAALFPSPRRARYY